jgi:uncharacterized protein (TIGR02466 family)
MSIQSWFPTFIYEAALEKRGGLAFALELEGECRKIQEQDADGQTWSKKNYPGGYTSYGSLCRLHKMSSTFMELEKKITRHVKKYTRHLDMDLRGCRLEMTDCWINRMSAQATHALHLHPLSIVSGTYYVKTPPGSSHLRFEDPRLDKFMNAPPKMPKCKTENQPYVSYPVEPGKIILFESWLRHEVASNLIADRISISFNYNWFGA